MNSCVSLSSCCTCSSPGLKLIGWFPDSTGLNPGSICEHICSPNISPTHAPLLHLLFFFFSFISLSSISASLPQFDHSFVEVYRVRKFRFQPRHSEELSLEDLSDDLKKNNFSPICSTTNTCNYGIDHSSWTCDGEILPQTDIQVRYTCECAAQLLAGVQDPKV